MSTFWHVKGLLLELLEDNAGVNSDLLALLVRRARTSPKKTFSSLSRIYGTKEAKLLVGRNVYESRGRNFGEKHLELNKKLLNCKL